MVGRETTKRRTQGSTVGTGRPGARADAAAGFSEQERAAMKERARELKAETGRGSRARKKVDGERAVIDKLAEMPEADRTLGERLHAIITAHAPSLVPKLWYGMPAYAAEDGKIVCFFQGAEKFSARYATLGFNDAANLDDGTMWPTSFALTALTAADEARIAALVSQAVT